MSIINLETKNTRTIAILSLVTFIGTAILVWLTKANYFDYGFNPNDLPNPYLTAFQPLLYAGLPILMIITFVFSVIVATREELPKARWQASFFALVIIVLAYIYSFMMTSQGF